MEACTNCTNASCTNIKKSYLIEKCDSLNTTLQELHNISKKRWSNIDLVINKFYVAIMLLIILNFLSVISFLILL